MSLNNFNEPEDLEPEDFIEPEDFLEPQPFKDYTDYRMTGKLPTFEEITPETSLAIAPEHNEEAEPIEPKPFPYPKAESVHLTSPCGWSISLSSNRLSHIDLFRWVDCYHKKYLQGGIKKTPKYLG